MALNDIQLIKSVLSSDINQGCLQNILASELSLGSFSPQQIYFLCSFVSTFMSSGFMTFKNKFDVPRQFYKLFDIY